MTNPRIALVTGAAQGLGREIAEQLAKQGHTVVISDILHADAQRTADEICAAGHTASAVALDVADESAVKRAYAEVEARYGRLDILVNNAGISGERSPVEAMPLQAWEKTIRINLTSAFMMSRGAIALMRRNGWGRIINMSSLSARSQPGTMRSPYVASKMGMIAFSRVLAEELGRDGITVNCVAPSRIRTALTIATSGGKQEYWDRGAAGSVLGRLGEPVDIANGVVWLCSERASFITGTVLDVNGGTVMQ